mmetsp:Transcript_70422/g.199690  ORF Transcript_70422/g.199690 Transcript_70422/m.199690 type:complete len:206 (-) Transcript_70422:148-765(-)
MQHQTRSRKVSRLLPPLALATGLVLCTIRAVGPRSRQAAARRPILGFFPGFPQPPQPQEQQEEDDWKEEAYRRQQEKIAGRKAKLSPDYVESPEERMKRRQKQLLWQRAQRQGVDDVVGGRSSVVLEVELEKPLGIEFAERDVQEGGGIFIRELSEGSAEGTKLEPGDILAAVEDTNVEGMPFQDAVRPIKEATGPIRMTFLRPA